jgi:hypothetical protein
LGGVAMSLAVVTKATAVPSAFTATLGFVSEAHDVAKLAAARAQHGPALTRARSASLMLTSFGAVSSGK